MNEIKEYIASRRGSLGKKDSGQQGWQDCLREMDLFLKACHKLREEIIQGLFEEGSMDELEEIWDGLFDAVKPENYETSWLYPPFAKERLSGSLGGLLSAVYADLLTGGVFFAVQNDEKRLRLLSELFSGCKKACFAERAVGAPDDPLAAKETGRGTEHMAEALRQAVTDFYCKHVKDFTQEPIRLMVSPDKKQAIPQILSEETDLRDLRYLYRYGYYVGSNEKKLAVFLSGLSDEQADTIAKTFVGGYIKGFAATGKDITKKNTVKVEYPIGFERVIRRARMLFEEEGLAATFVPEPVLSLTGRGSGKRGVYATAFNRRFDFDHKDDRGWYLCDRLDQERLRVMEAVFEEYKVAAGGHGGPAVMEVFGETEFQPDPWTKNYTYTEEQNRQNVIFTAKSQELSNRYIPGEERSYTIIAFPVPEIGEDFPEIFQKIVEVNTLDYVLYRDIQQKLIRALDRGVAVEVRGAKGNCTDMHIVLHELSDPEKQTNFENCVADVNIPVGEVFTSPVLEGTEGTLFVSHVYLGAYEYHDLKLVFRDGMVTDYSCGRFKDEEEGRRFIEDNILHHHRTLPIGEFAIGTNTLAYRMARDFAIESKLPILIMEKTGPHFAVGDTCYSYAEDIPMFNPDGRECIARDNSISILRKSDDEAKRKSAYFHCHTDITIPFDELERITVLGKDGQRTDLIRDGRFVLEGTEALNEPLDRN